MAGVQGRNGRNTEKLAVKESNVPSVGFRSVRALHAAVLNDVLIDITALTDPASAVSNGYVAPTTSDLQKVSLKQFKDNVTLRTGSTTLIQDVDFVVTGARTIKLTTPALSAQIFELIINAEPRIGLSIVDGAPLISTGVLLTATTDFNVGNPFKVGQYPTNQVGAVQVFADGVLQKRNVGNQSGGAGDYYEVHAGAGLGVIVRFNASIGADRDISVVSVGSLIERPNGSQDAYIDTLAGQIDVIRSEVETQHSITIPIGAPNNVDLKAFGDRVLTLENAGSGGGHVIEDEGTPLTQRANMDFTGAGVSVSDTGGKTVVTVAGGAAPVDSVNTQTGAVVLDADDLSDAATTNKFTTSGDISKLSGIEASATADQSDAEIETAYNNQVGVVSQAEAEAGTATTVRRWTALRVAEAIAALGSSTAPVDSVNTQTGAVVLDTDDVAEGATNNYANTAGGQSDIDGNTNVSANTTHRGVVAGNPHSVTKTNIGLGSVTNDAQVPLSQKGAASGVATLDASSRIPAAQLPTSATEYKGAWNATTNSPTLVDATGTNGDMYRVDTAGTQDLGSGSISYVAGDVVIYNGSIWQKIPANDLVASVNSQVGVVVLDADDLSDAATTQKFTTSSDISKLSGIETSATTDQSDAEIETAYNNQVDVVSQVTAEAGTSTTVERWTALRVAQAIAALGSSTAPVDSVNTQTGAVVLDADDLSDAATTNKFTTSGDISKLSGIEASATADQSDAEIETAYNNQVGVVSQAEAEAGTATTVRRWTALRVAEAIAALGSSTAPVDSVNTQTGAVVLDADDISDAATTNKFTSSTDISKLSGIEASATADQSDAEIEIAYNNQVGIVSQAEAEAGTATTVRRWTALRVAEAIAALETSALVTSVNTATGAVVLDTDDVAEGATNNYANTAGGQSDIDGNTNVSANTTHRGVVAGNPHAITKGDVGLGNVTNDTQVPLSQKGVASGVATLDATSRIPAAQLPISVMEYKGAWNATTNSPTLADGGGTNGDMYRVSTSGSQDLGSGSISYSIGDAVIYNGTIWERIPADDVVLSVNSQLGVIVLDADDLSDAATTNKFTTATEISKLAGIEASATIDQTDVEIETAYSNQVSTVSQAEAEAGTATTVRRWTALRVAQAIMALETVGGSLSNVVEDTTPQLGGNLDVNGSGITSTAGLDIAIGSSAGNDFTIDTNKLIVEGDTGNVGIGLNPGTWRLAAQGSVAVSDMLLILQSSAFLAKTTIETDSSGSAFLKLFTGATAPIQLHAGGFTFFTGGNVGFGVTDPDEQIELMGRMHIGQTTAPVTTTDKLYNVAGALTWNGSAIPLSPGISNVVEDITPQLGGDLDVNGSDITSATGLNIAIGASAGNDFTVDTNKLVVEGDTGRVGVGVIAPVSQFHVAGSATGALQVLAIGNLNDGGSSDAVAFGFHLERVGGGFAQVAGLISAEKEQLWTTTPSTVNGALTFATVANEVIVEHVRINSAGLVGIGVSDPDEKLEVAGRIHIGQTIAPATTTDKLYNVAGALTWNGTDLTAGGASKEGARVFHSGTQTVNTGTPTVLNFDSESFDTGNIHDNSVNNSRLTVGNTGRYMVGFKVELDPTTAAPANTNPIEVRINKNAATQSFTHEQNPISGSKRLSISGSTLLNMTSGDFVEIQIFHNAAVSLIFRGVNVGKVSFWAQEM